MMREPLCKLSLNPTERENGLSNRFFPSLFLFPPPISFFFSSLLPLPFFCPHNFIKKKFQEKRFALAEEDDDVQDEMLEKSYDLNDIHERMREIDAHTAEARAQVYINYIFIYL